MSVFVIPLIADTKAHILIKGTSGGKPKTFHIVTGVLFDQAAKALDAGSINIIDTVIGQVRLGHGDSACMNFGGLQLHCASMLVAGVVGALAVAALTLLSLIDVWRWRRQRTPSPG